MLNGLLMRRTLKGKALTDLEIEKFLRITRHMIRIIWIDF